MKLRQASPEKHWGNLTPQHKGIQEDLQQSIHNVANGGEEDPRAIVGAYGSGKTQLLYEAFRIAWEDAEIPALYTDADAILRGYEASGQDSITAWLSERVREQVEALSNGKSASWLPNFASRAKKEKWLKETASSADISADQSCVLLVDEVEQAYESLQKRIATDDKNTLRGLLDEVQGVYQVWSFGLISAYEILGEADLRRFKELRVPVLQPSDIHEVLVDSDKPSELTNGIWWLARGRTGWVNKLVDEAPSDFGHIPDWFNRISDYEFFGTNPVDQSVITGHLLDESGEWDKARRSLLFLPDGYDQWEFMESRSVLVSGASEGLLNVLTSDENPDPRGIRILERNIERVLDALSTNQWQGYSDTTDKPYLPAVIFTREEEMASLLSLIQNQITSFEPRGDARGGAIELIREATPEEVADQWTLQGVNIEDKVSRTTRPKILEQAYPSIAVDPNVLTSKTSQYLREELSNPVEVDPGIRLDHVEVKVQFCPTKRSFDQAIQELKSSTEIPKTYLLIKPDTPDASDWDAPDLPDALLDYNRVKIIERGSTQLHDFVVQLHEYLQNADIQYSILTDETVREAVSQETERKIIDTIETLHGQIERIVRNGALETRDEFIEAYSLEDADQPIWADSDLNEPFWAYGRATSVPLTGLAYTLAVAEGEWDGPRDVLQLPERLLEGYGAGLVDSAERNFRFQQFLDLIFLPDGFSRPVRTKREDFGSAHGTVDPAIRRLQNLLLHFLEYNLEEDIQNLRYDLLDVETETDKVEIIQASQFEHQQAPALIWGLLLDALVRKDRNRTIEDIEKIRSRLNEIAEDISNVQETIEGLNEELEPPDNYGKGVSVKPGSLAEYRRNIESVKESITALSGHIEEDPTQASIAQVMAAIVGRYAELLDESVNEMIDPVYDSEIMIAVESLKARFKSLESRVEGNNELTEQTTLSKDEINEQLSIIGNQLFDFSDPLATTSIDLEDIDKIEKVAGNIQTNLSELNRLESAFNRLESIQANRVEREQELIDETKEFLEATMEEG